MKNKLILILILWLIIISLTYYINQNNLKKQKEFFGFSFISILMNIKEYLKENPEAKEIWYVKFFEKINKNISLFDLYLKITNNSQRNNNISKEFLSDFTLIKVKNNCFAFGFNLNNVSKDFEPKKSQFINTMWRLDYNIPWSCKKDQKCFIYFTEKWILGYNEAYDCK